MPYVFAALGAFLPVLYFLVRYWTRSHVKVNCWFCGLNSFVPKQCHDGWICKNCEQYNGFKADGDYNRDIPAQWDSSVNGRLSYCSRPSTYSKSSNGLCDECNRNQEMKVAQLSSFQPINPENFDQEIENFSYHLERAYRLCPPCESVVEETLSRKKTHVLDMNLQLTGKRSRNGSYFTSKTFKNSLAQTSAILTIAIAVAIALSTISSFSSKHFIFKFISQAVDEGTPTTVATSSVKSIFVPHFCFEEDLKTISPPVYTLSEDLNEYVGAVLRSIGSHCMLLCIAVIAIQGLSIWHSGFKLSSYLCITFVGTVIFQEIQSKSDYTQIVQIFQVLLALLMLGFSWPEIYQYKSRSTPFKKLQSTSVKSTSRKSESFHQSSHQPYSSSVHTGVPPQNSSQPTPLKSRQNSQDSLSFETSNYLTLPPGPPSVTSSHRTLTSASVIAKAAVGPPVDNQSIVSQEDNRSDGSVDSAFSNPDSITLDAADSLNLSCLPSKKQDSQDDDVNSLIEGLSIGSVLSSHSRRSTSAFKNRSFTQDKKRTSLLCPSKLGNIMNESMRSGIWRNSNTNLVSNCAAGAADSGNLTVSRPVSPCGSVHSQATAQTVESIRSFSPPLSFQSAPAPWNVPPSSPNVLSVCVPPNTHAANPGFGSIASPILNSPMSQVIYTPYGLYHQMMSPYGNQPMYMIPPQSPPFTGRSPHSSYGSQFSPQSFSTSSRFCDSDHDPEFSPKSTKGRQKTKAALSSSFLESMWQSRFAIMYTTLCYVLIGFIVCAFSYSGLVSNISTNLFN